MLIFFRTDASINIGTGHVMRCLTLADVLRKRGVFCRFICREHPGNLIGLISQKGYEVVALPMPQTTDATVKGCSDWLGLDWHEDAKQTRLAIGEECVDWLVVDHYAIDIRWEEMLRKNCKRMMVIDDLANRSHNCDLFLDQNFGRCLSDYNGLLNTRARALIGSKYALLRPEFCRLRAKSLMRRVGRPIKIILITMGGIDKDNVTEQILEALKACLLPRNVQITVVMGEQAPWLSRVSIKALEMPWETQVLVNVANMAEVMVESDLAIGAAGSTSWERCCVGLPTIQVVLADNQAHIAKALYNAGAAAIADIDNLSCDLSDLLRVIGDGSRLQSMSNAAKDIVDGNGADNVVDFLLKGICEDNIAM